MSRSNTPSGVLRVSTTADDAVDDQMELFMRHSSPLEGRRQSPSIAASRNSSSPSPMGLSRPRSNPRNRTPMRFESPLGNADIIPEEPATNEGRRITILPMAGSARGTHHVSATLRNRQDSQQHQHHQTQKSHKQGPSHRKVRRWNNSNFVNLAAEVDGNNGKKAAQALLAGHMNASKYHSIYPNEHSQNSIMTRLAQGQNEELQYVRDKFYKGELYSHENEKKTKKINKPKKALTREERMNHIDKRLRRVVVRAIENSYPATKVMERLEHFLLSVFACDETTTHESSTNPEDWKDILSEPPTVSTVSDKKLIRFLFDKDSSTGGFNRLLLHALVQFHGLTASSTTSNNGRMLTATGSLLGGQENEFKLVDCIMQQQQANEKQAMSGTGSLELETSRMAALTV